MFNTVGIQVFPALPSGFSGRIGFLEVCLYQFHKVVNREREIWPVLILSSPKVFPMLRIRDRSFITRAKSRGPRKKVNSLRGGGQKKQNNPRGGPEKT